VAKVSISVEPDKRLKSPHIWVTAEELDAAEFDKIKGWFKDKTSFSYHSVTPRPDEPGMLTTSFNNKAEAGTFINFLTDELGVLYANGEFSDINTQFGDAVIEFDSYKTKNRKHR
jgi:hypothetical protein